MRFKLDENLHPDVAETLRQQGHDALTVFEQGLRGHADDDVAEVCRREGRTLITLDLDFANVRDYPPGDSPGIIVLRLASTGRTTLLRAIGRILPLLLTEPLSGHLWIVDDSRVRIRGPETGASP